MADERAALSATITHLEQIVNDDDLCDRLHDHLAADAQFRHRVEEALRRAELRLQGPGRTVERYAITGIELSTVQIGCRLGVWDDLVKQAPAAIEAETLAKNAGMNGTMMLRLLRYAAAQDMVKQVDRTRFRANRRTEHLALQSVCDATLIAVDLLAPQHLAFPDHLKSMGYAEPTDPNNTAWHHLGKGQGMFEWLGGHPLYANAFNHHMTFLQKNCLPWLDDFPLEEYMDVDNSDEQRVQFCDVAGGNGQQTFNVVQKYPTLKGRLVVQDRPDMTFTQNEGVQFLAFDLFQPNPTKGARVYYLRHILHDFPDESCRQILGHVRDVMELDSVILINDMLIRDVDTRDYPTSFDIAMCVSLSGKERTDHEWNILFNSAGLNRVSVVEYDPRGMAIQVLKVQ